MGSEAELAEIASHDLVHPSLVDVRDAGALEAAVAEAEHRWSGLDAAIAAAGVIAGGGATVGHPGWSNSRPCST